jgi:hypothetical protein
MSYQRSLMILWMLSMAAFVAALAGCSSLTVGSDYDRAAVFSNWQTFTLMHRDHRGMSNPLVATRAEGATERTSSIPNHASGGPLQQRSRGVDCPSVVDAPARPGD